jgi:hypothetical protein
VPPKIKKIKPFIFQIDALEIFQKMDLKGEYSPEMAVFPQHCSGGKPPHCYGFTYD